MRISATALAADVSAAAQTALWAVVLLLASIAALVALAWLRRRWLQDGGQQSSGAAAVPLDEIRRLHQQGVISDAERDALRARTLLVMGGEPPIDPRPSEEPTVRQDVESQDSASTQEPPPPTRSPSNPARDPTPQEPRGT